MSNTQLADFSAKATIGRTDKSSSRFFIFGLYGVFVFVVVFVVDVVFAVTVDK